MNRQLDEATGHAVFIETLQDIVMDAALAVVDFKNPKTVDSSVRSYDKIDADREISGIYKEVMRSLHFCLDIPRTE